MKKATNLSALVFLLFLFIGINSASAQVSLDGTITESEWYSHGTSSGGPSPGFGSGHEINALYSFFDTDSLNIAIAGNVQSGNRIIVFLDTKSGGFSDGSFNRSNSPEGVDEFNSSTTFDSGFEADYALIIGTNGDQSDYFVDLFTLDASSGSNNFIGNASSTEVGASPSNASTTAGFEIRLSNSEVGLESGHLVKAFALYSSDGGFLSNQFISVGGSSDSNYGSGAITFGSATPNPVNLSFSVEISGIAGWRLLSLPIENWDLSDISDDTAIQGVTGGSDAAADTNVATYDASGLWEIPASVTTEIPEGTGMAVYFFNNTTNGSSELPITLDASGAEPSSDVVVDLYSGATGRYTLVGNPFASNVDLANVSANIAISSNMTFWDNTAGSYTTESISGGLIIEPWQGYWVQTSAATAGGQLTFGTADKTSSAADTTHFDKVNPNTLKELKFTIESSYNTEKNLILQVAEDATSGWDNYDLLKLNSLLPQNVSAAFVGDLDNEQVLKGIESISSSLENEITLPIVVDLVGDSQALRMSWAGLSELPESWSVLLHDYETGENIDLRSQTDYEFDMNVGSSSKVNPLTILRSSIGQTMKLKTNHNVRFGLTITPQTTSVTTEPASGVTEFTLDQNYPNPFNPSTTINYSVENSGAVTLSVYNLMGQKVAELVNETKSAGSYNVIWNASQAASGMYYYRLEAGGQVLTRKMTLIK